MDIKFMILPDHEIKKYITNGNIGITPFDESLIQPASLDFRLGNTVRFQKDIDPYFGPVYDPLDPEEIDMFHSPLEFIYYILKPHELVLLSTLERIKIPDYLSAQVAGKSSLARIGLSIHETAGYIDPGFEGNITLEVTNKSNYRIKLTAGMVIGQFVFTELSSVCKKAYGSAGLGSHYQGQTGATTSRYGK